MERPLTADEAALWARVLETVRPIRTAAVAPVSAPQSAATPSVDPGRKARRAPAPAIAIEPRSPPGKPKIALRAAPAGQPNTLDGTWDRQLSRGLVSPDRAIDLHGHNLGSAYDLLDSALARAIAEGDRVVLLITGKPPRPASQRPHARGAIRAAVGDWLAGSRHAAAIAAVRGAHPRHGGSGALYIVLRRVRAGPKS